ncbi:MAG TPA: SRPBCC family protein [Jatrophihabitans sp.]|nr:SRPBCC family protein [Jatrophihabitans sp.]
MSTTVTRTFRVEPSPTIVLDYLKDFGHAEQWDPGTESCRRIGSGPIQIGSSWLNTSKIAGISTELSYTLERLTADTIVLVGRNDSATSTDTITVRPDGTGSEVTYRADIEMHSTVGKLATPAVKLVFEKLGNDTERQLVEVLNAL